MTLGEKIYKARKEAHLTLKKLSDISGVKYSTLHAYEKDHCEPSFFNICCLADALKLPLDYLAGIGTSDINPDKLRVAIQCYLDHTSYYIPRDDQKKMDYIVAAAIELHNSMSPVKLDQIFLWE